MLGAPCRFLFPAALGRYGFVEQQVLLELEGDALVNGHVFFVRNFSFSVDISTVRCYVPCSSCQINGVRSSVVQVARQGLIVMC